MSSEADAEDVAQDALIRAWRMRHACRSADPRAWLRQIARNESLRAHTARQPHLPLDDLGERGEDDDAVEAAPERLSVDAALQQLDPLDRRLLALRYGADLTQPRIAELLGMPEGTVKVRLHRARRALAEEMGER
jgi:RNA polymerase sigma-70 factor, ECF subfamily